AANLFNHFTDTQYLWADGSNWDRRAVADSDYVSFKGNTLELLKLPVDPGFGDAALTRLFNLPSRITDEQWKVFAAQIGSSAAPAVQKDPEPAVDAAKAASAKPASSDSSLSSLLASLDSISDKVKAAADSHKVTAPLYCPIFDWKKALAL